MISLILMPFLALLDILLSVLVLIGFGVGVAARAANALATRIWAFRRLSRAELRRTQAETAVGLGLRRQEEVAAPDRYADGAAAFAAQQELSAARREMTEASAAVAHWKDFVNRLNKSARRRNGLWDLSS